MTICLPLKGEKALLANNFFTWEPDFFSSVVLPPSFAYSKPFTRKIIGTQLLVLGRNLKTYVHCSSITHRSQICSQFKSLPIVGWIRKIQRLFSLN